MIAHYRLNGACGVSFGRHAANSNSSRRPTLARKNVTFFNESRQHKSRIYTEEGATETEDAPEIEESDTEVMSMSDSLIERAQEVASSGVVDDTFKEVFVEELKQELESVHERAKSAEAMSVALEDTLKATKEQFVRLSADFENFRKRTQTEQENLKSSVKGDTLVALLPLVDNFELAKQQIKIETEGEQKIDAAYQGLYKQMVELFRSLGLEAVPGVGAPFDPEVHEAIMREHSDEFDDGVVMEEFRKGFQLGDRLLRPAMVKVAYKENSVENSDQE